MADGSLKIVVISNAAGSLVRFRGPLLRLLVERGHQVHTLAPEYTEEECRELEALGVLPESYRIERTGQNPLSDLRTLRDLAGWMRRAKPDISLTYFIKPNIYGGLAAAMAGVPRRVAMVEGLGYLFTPGANDPISKRLMRGLAVTLLKISFSRAHKVLFLNVDDQAEFIQRGIVSPAKADLIGGIGVDLNEFPVAPLPAGPISFLMIGRLLREKGVREFVEAAGRLKERFPEARFHLVGGTDANPGAISVEEARTFSSDGGVEWLGELADVRPAIADCSVYVLPSYREGVPRSTQEAMAMGRPVVTTDVPGCRETVVEGVNGFFAAARDTTSLAGAMQRFCENPDLVHEMGRQSRRMAEEKFDVVRVNARIYAALTGAGGD